MSTLEAYYKIKVLKPKMNETELEETRESSKIKNINTH